MKYISRFLRVILVIVVVPIWWLIAIIYSLLSFSIYPFVRLLCYILNGPGKNDKVEKFFESTVNEIFDKSIEFGYKVLDY